MNNKFTVPFIVTTLVVITFAIGPFLSDGKYIRWFISGDQAGAWWFHSQQYSKAADSFSNSFAKGAAYYRNGEFKLAAQYFSYESNSESYYNRGNALLMGGQYEEAIESYQRALKENPQWLQAKQNLKIARMRAEQIKREGGEGTDGKLGADDIVFDNSKSPETQNTDQTEQVMADQALSEAEQQAMWLRRVQTKPADFLRVKFQYQAANSTTTIKPDHGEDKP